MGIDVSTVFFYERYLQLDLFRRAVFSSKFFFLQSSQLKKLLSATIAFFLFSSFHLPRSFFPFPFPLLVWFSKISCTKKPLPFGPFSLKWLQISLGSFLKSRLEICADFCTCTL